MVLNLRSPSLFRLVCRHLHRHNLSFFILWRIDAVYNWLIFCFIVFILIFFDLNGSTREVLTALFAPAKGLMRPILSSDGSILHLCGEHEKFFFKLVDEKLIFLVDLGE